MKKSPKARLDWGTFTPIPANKTDYPGKNFPDSTVDTEDASGTCLRFTNRFTGANGDHIGTHDCEKKSRYSPAKDNVYGAKKSEATLGRTDDFETALYSLEEASSLSKDDSESSEEVGDFPDKDKALKGESIFSPPGLVTINPGA